MVNETTVHCPIFYIGTLDVDTMDNRLVFSTKSFCLLVALMMSDPGLFAVIISSTVFRH